MKKIIVLLLIIFTTAIKAQAFDLMPIDDDEISLPPTDSIPEIDFEANNIEEPIFKSYNIKQGTILELISKSTITDRMKKGTTVKFSLKTPVITKDGEKIPEGTIFKGTITDSHPPQISANGGLVSLNINQIIYKGSSSRISSKTIRANNKILFREDIKGEHSYFKNYGNSLTKGKKIFKNSKNCSNKLSRIPVIKYTSFVPTVFGTAVLAGNIVLSPVITFFSKGGSVTIPSGTTFKIKITNDSII